MSTLEMRDSFFQILLAEESRPLTAVRTPVGLYQYTRMPQGLKNSPATLQRVINATLGDLKGRSAFAYTDDLTVGSVDAESHFRDLREVFHRLRKKGVKLKLSKCCFGRRSVDILGRRFTSKGLQPNENDLAAVRRYAEPYDASLPLRFIGICRFLEAFKPDLARWIRPLYEVLARTGIRRSGRRFRG
mmetsp:Transcript_7288/g.10875  ORF Transcript_7288/g.10875 Transcript_7288/m.10875 type:complete len:188 (-) Transcript_7288:2411-2974(-)